MSAEWSKKAFQKCLLSPSQWKLLKSILLFGTNEKVKKQKVERETMNGFKCRKLFQGITYIIGTHHSCRKYFILLFLSPKCGSTLCSFRPWTHLPFSPLLMAFYTQPKIRGFSSINFMRRRKNILIPPPPLYDRRMKHRIGINSFIEDWKRTLRFCQTASIDEKKRKPIKQRFWLKFSQMKTKSSLNRVSWPWHFKLNFCLWCFILMTWLSYFNWCKNANLKTFAN